MLNKKILLIILETIIILLFVLLVFDLKTSQNIITKSDVTNNDKNVSEINLFYTKQIDDYKLRLEQFNANTKNHFFEYTDYSKNLQLSIHTFVATELKYNPYLPINILENKIKTIFDTTHLSYHIVISNNLPNGFQQKDLNENIKIINHISVSKTIHNEYLILECKFKELKHNHNSFLYNFKEFTHLPLEHNQTVIETTTSSTKFFLDQNFKKIVILFIILLGLYRLISILINKNKKNKILDDFYSGKDIDFEAITIDQKTLNIIKQSQERKDALVKTIDNEQVIKKQFKKFVEDSTHQLNTPLTAIELNLDLMEMELNNKNEYLENIKVSIDLLKLYNNELTYIASDKTLYKPSLINGSLILYSRKKLFELIEKISNKKIIFKIESQILLFINHDEFLLLVNNNLIALLKISKQYTSITISFTKANKKATLIFSSEDFDSSISEEIFDNYYRESEKERKTGSGLYLSKEICIKNSIKFNISQINKTNLFEYHFDLTSI